MKVVRKTRKTMVYTTAKTLCYTMPKTKRKKLHQGTKANCRSRIYLRVLTTNMKMTTEPVLRLSTVTEAATEEVTGILASEEGPCNG